MFSIHKISDAGAAFNYFRDRDDYYSSDASSAEWWGTGAERLGLRGDVESQTFRDILEGKVGDQQVGRSGFRGVFGADGRAHKVPNHAAGWDVTFSAPKSFSIAGLVHRDDRLVATHDRAVRTAMAYIEQQVAVTRQRSKDGSYVYRSTAGLVAAMFRHASSRDHDPQLHTHVVVANVTWDETTHRWVSLWSREGLYRIHAQAESIYQNELAAAAREAGYSVEWSVDDHGFPTAEVAEIGAQERALFSQRKAEIDAALATKGTTRERATQRQREAATLETRSPKEHIEASEQHRLWQDRLEQSGLARNIQSAPVRGNRRHGADAADTAVTAAIASLSERSARFTANDLLTEARIFSQGRANEPELEAAVMEAKDRGDLIVRKTRVRVPGGDRVLVDGFTTEKGETIEKAMLAAADRIAGGGGNRLRIGEAKVHGNTPEVIAGLIADAEARTGRALTAEHRAAVSGILTANSELYLLDGRAGTAKTTGVLAVVAGHAEANGWRVRAMAPTASAAATLGDAIEAESSTVAKVIARPPARDARPELWIVDEAGLASAQDTADLLEQANRVGAHVILTGDDRQIGSVGAGRAFQQLQDAHPDSTYRLTDIKRQRSATLKQAVIASVDGRVAVALDRVQVAEHADRDGAIATIADAYMRNNANGKDTLVVALSRADRAEINGAIQQRRETAGEVFDAQEVTTLAAKGWTAEQRKDASRYHAGDVIVAHREFKPLARGESATVTRVDDNKVTVQTARGEWTFDPKRIAAYNVMNAGQTRVGDGDRIVLKGTTGALINGEHQQLRNGTVLTVTGIHENRITATDARNRQVEIDASHGVQADLAYAQTADQAQGRTVDTVIGYMRSGQSNLATQQRAYVLLSRARDDALIVTDNKPRLAEALTKNRGDKETALERGAGQFQPVARDDGPLVVSRSTQPLRRQADNTQTNRQESGLARLQAMAIANLSHAAQAPTRDTRHGAQHGHTVDDGRDR
jgi:conjugative relaxase-like TrwC/TraI family protein